MEYNLRLLRKQLELIEVKKLQINKIITEKINDLYLMVGTNDIEKVTDFFVCCKPYLNLFNLNRVNRFEFDLNYGY